MRQETGHGEDMPAKKGGAALGKDSALLIVDMVNPFDFEGAEALLGPARRAARNIRVLRDRFDRADAPVVYVNDNFMHWKGQFSDLVASMLGPPAPGAEIVQLLQPGPLHYHVLKPKHSGFHATPLEILLQKLGARRLVITGIATDSCVLATAQDAHMLELALWVPSDCTAAQSPQRKRRALALMAESHDASTRPAVRQARRARR
jgi:nicotinamidase-related amidase